MTELARYCRQGIVHLGRLRGSPDGIDVVVTLCGAWFVCPFPFGVEVFHVLDDVDCMSCLVKEARRS